MSRHKNFQLSEWRPIAADEFVRRLHALQREASLMGEIVAMETIDLCRDQFVTEFALEDRTCELLLLHANLEEGSEQLPFRRR